MQTSQCPDDRPMHRQRKSWSSPIARQLTWPMQSDGFGCWHFSCWVEHEMGILGIGSVAPTCRNRGYSEALDYSSGEIRPPHFAASPSFPAFLKRSQQVKRIMNLRFARARRNARASRASRPNSKRFALALCEPCLIFAPPAGRPRRLFPKHAHSPELRFYRVERRY